MSTITAAELELMNAFMQLDAARMAYTAAQVRYRAALDQVQAQDREEAARG